MDKNVINRLGSEITELEKIPDKTPTQEYELNNLVQIKKKLESEIDKGQTRLESVGSPYKTRKKVLVLSYVKYIQL